MGESYRASLESNNAGLYEPIMIKYQGMLCGGLWTNIKSQRSTSGLLRTCLTSVQTSDGDTDDFPIRIGLRQGSALSHYLFALVMDEITRDIQGDIPWCMLFRGRCSAS